MPRLFDPGKWERCYKNGDPLGPIGTTTTLGGDLVRKWSYDVINRDLEPVWPGQHHTLRLGADDVERTIRIIYGPDTQMRSYDHARGGIREPICGLSWPMTISNAGKRGTNGPSHWSQVFST